MAQIRSLRPNVTREEAIQQFNGGSPFQAFRNLTFGPLRSVAEAYIPFRIFQVRIVNRGRSEECLLGLDAVTGTLDLYQFDHLPTEQETVCVQTRNSPAATLPAGQAAEMLMAKLRRTVYRRGFFRMRDLQLSAEPLSGELHIPYWLGFRGSREQARIAVIDAVRRRPEGSKVRGLVEAWLSDTAEL